MDLNVGIYLFPDVEPLDFAGPYEVFTTADRLAGRTESGDGDRLRVFSIATTSALVRLRGGMRVLPDHTVDDHPPVDVLVIPGGIVAREMNDPRVLHWVKECAGSASRIASVCTGVFLLAHAGVIRSGQVTTHWEDRGELARSFPLLEVVDGPRWVEQGPIITSAGISAGIDMSLHLLGRLRGLPLAKATARQMDYPWPEAAGVSDSRSGG